MSAETDALQAAVVGELAAVYGYGQAAGALRRAELDRARRELDAHRARRDRLAALLRDQDVEPSAGPVAFDVGTTNTATEARAALAGIENRLTGVYADLVAASTGAARALAVTAMQESAVRAVRWGDPLPDFPGIAERA